MANEMGASIEQLEPRNVTPEVGVNRVIELTIEMMEALTKAWIDPAEVEAEPEVVLDIAHAIRAGANFVPTEKPEIAAIQDEGNDQWNLPDQK